MFKNIEYNFIAFVIVSIMGDKNYIICPVCGDVHVLEKDQDSIICSNTNIKLNFQQLFLNDYVIVLDRDIDDNLNVIKKHFLMKTRNLVNKYYYNDLNADGQFILKYDALQNKKPSSKIHEKS